MNWEAIGAIGEILGAFAVFASLLYLAIQIRHNSRLSEVDLTRRALESYSNFRGLAIENAEVISRDSDSRQSLDDVVLNNLAAEFAFSCASNFEAATLLGSDRRNRFVTAMQNALSNPESFHARHWPDNSRALRNVEFDEFVDLVNQATESH